MVEVANDGRARSSGTGDGHGLAGLTHRVVAEHGRFEATATEPDGFRMRVALPCRPTVPA